MLRKILSLLLLSLKRPKLEFLKKGRGIDSVGF